MYYGFPERRDEIRDYLKDILHGREPPESLVKENLEKLDIVGGESPSTEIVKGIKTKLAKKLEPEGYSIYLLSKHYKPSINDSGKLVTEERVYEVPLFPVYSKFIFDGYYIPLEAHLKDRKIVRISHIGFESGMIEFYRKRIEGLKDGLLTFSAHSIPLEGYDPYPESILKLSKLIAGGRKFINIYHSQGPFHPSWLTPYPEHAISYSKEHGFGKIQVVPIGFIYEHLEVLYDLDYKLKNEAEEAGIRYERIPLPNDSDVVIDSIVNIIHRSGD
jgi:ferrochelatase